MRNDDEDARKRRRVNINIALILMGLMGFTAIVAPPLLWIYPISFALVALVFSVLWLFTTEYRIVRQTLDFVFPFCSLVVILCCVYWALIGWGRVHNPVHKYGLLLVAFFGVGCPAVRWYRTWSSEDEFWKHAAMRERFERFFKESDASNATLRQNLSRLQMVKVAAFQSLAGRGMKTAPTQSEMKAGQYADMYADDECACVYDPMIGALVQAAIKSAEITEILRFSRDLFEAAEVYFAHEKREGLPLPSETVAPVKPFEPFVFNEVPE